MSLPIPGAVATLLAAVADDAWVAVETALAFVVHGGDSNNMRVRAEALTAHAALRLPLPAVPHVPVPVALSSAPKAQ
jgi:hypothetical protein